jgi:hypothetical protein
MARGFVEICELSERAERDSTDERRAGEEDALGCRLDFDGVLAAVFVSSFFRACSFAERIAISLVLVPPSLAGTLRAQVQSKKANTLSAQDLWACRDS